MPEIDDIFITEDLSSGRFHRRLKFEGRVYVQEGCNLDDAGGYKVLPRAGLSRAIDNRGVPVGTDESMLCQNCFPRS